MSGTLWLTLVIAAGASFAPDRLAAPRGAVRRAASAWTLHALAVICIASLFLLVTARPVFSACGAIALVALVAVVSNAKYESLREPFVFTDLSLFSQLFSHPRLYLPFLSAGKVVAIGIGVLAVVSGFLAEPPLTPRPWVAALLAGIATFLASCALARRLPLTLDPAGDVERHGFFTVFVAYLLNGLRPATFDGLKDAAATSPFALDGATGQYPDVIVIQSESFFDARRITPAVNSALFTHFDCACNESVQYGALSVPAWGANTMRTEFSLLTGLASQKLGYARFYPYAFVRRACASIASWFRRSGYETLALHPYYADFFGRDHALPLMGFDKFLDVEFFADALRAGPYVSDAAVTDAIISILDAGTAKPQFLFAMTMENHGPLHLERVEAGEAANYHTLGEDPAWRDLTAYLRHVANADAMIGRLLAYLRARRRDTVLCFYGDHVPALPHIFDRLGNVPSQSHYFIWRNFGDRSAAKQDLSVENLGAAVLQAMEASKVRDVSTGMSERTEKI
ncbi:phosphoglycerol transferase MdoB-like AlkP superfamily enzyme [Paraburkholderia silvatlantica]|uniref:Phosphoglycerol transferase MdoB-like AlkP superfamily enzyme n=1 Tax=Paraburkholderia silvatlantica TaxID=321895 RepID=A0A2V4TTW3_9BURK|nr:LTA synthase family protein [Paraburkholderia silvatlantica]PYE16581.1 phosphoglycerol transferase MdoB-like AlkP superfamily enzyme [Paraburkholderia silvatlantica]